MLVEKRDNTPWGLGNAPANVLEFARHHFQGFIEPVLEGAPLTLGGSPLVPQDIASVVSDLAIDVHQWEMLGEEGDSTGEIQSEGQLLLCERLSIILVVPQHTLNHVSIEEEIQGSAISILGLPLR